MRVFLLGGSGAIGRRLVPALAGRGHEVIATTRTPAKADELAALGARPEVLDGLDRAALAAAVAAARPDAVIHQATAIPGAMDLRHLDQTFTLTNRLRTEGTDNLIAAARAAGQPRLIAQSYTGWPNARDGGPVKTEDDPLDSRPPAAARRSLAALQHLEEAVTSYPGGVALRFGSFYGPGTSIGPGTGEITEMVRARRLPVVGGGTGIWSFIHIDDAATATVAALEQDGKAGVYNIVDDEPAPVAQWLPVLAAALGARPPLRLPGWLARPMTGELGLTMMTQARGSANGKAKRELDWKPQYPSWRDGFATLAAP
jgi:nucleoside-diphosphate-sugar epimerase